MTWFLLSLLAGMVGVTVWGVRALLRLGDSQREKMRREIAEDAAEKNQRQAEIFSEPASNIELVISRMRRNRDGK